jgi:hypothetical protein
MLHLIMDERHCVLYDLVAIGSCSVFSGTFVIEYRND